MAGPMAAATAEPLSESYADCRAAAATAILLRWRCVRGLVTGGGSVAVAVIDVEEFSQAWPAVRVPRLRPERGLELNQAVSKGCSTKRVIRRRSS